MEKNKPYWVEADTLEEAISILSDPSNISNQEVISQMLDNGEKYIEIEYGRCKPYGDELDCICETKGIDTITDDDLQIDWFDIAVDLYKDKQKASKKMEDCLKNIIAMKENMFKGY